MAHRLDMALGEVGFGWVREAVGDAELRWLSGGPRGASGPVRCAPDSPDVVALLSNGALRRLATEALGKPAFCVRGFLFDKSIESNWFVPWHQDVSVAVRARADVEGFQSWSVKEGVSHATAPRRVLERMVSLRVHLDDCREDDGPLRVIAASHCHGVLAESERVARAAQSPEACLARRGDVLVMRPLLLHASSRASAPSHRRVVHLEWACDELPPPLEWRWQA